MDTENPESSNKEEISDYLSTLQEEWKKEREKKNFRNWFNNKFPNGYLGYAPYYLLTHPWEILREWGYEIKYMFQRIFRGYDDYPFIYGINVYLSRFIPKLIRKLKDSTGGVPSDIFDYSEADENGQISEEEYIRGCEKWNNILEEIAIGFEQYEKLDHYYPLDKDKEEYKKWRRGFALFIKYFDGLID